MAQNSAVRRSRPGMTTLSTGLSTRSRSAFSRSGFTILELLLVLSVLAVLVGLSWPSVERYLVENRLRGSIRDLRRIAGGARAKAIETGLVYQFRYEPGGRNYIVLPQELPETAAASGVAQTNASGKTVKTPTDSGQLDESCFFPTAVPTQPGQIVVERLSQDVLALLETPSFGLNNVTWSQAVRFYPDGTADDISLDVENKNKLAMNFAIRGLTGVVYTGEVTRK